MSSGNGDPPDTGQTALLEWVDTVADRFEAAWKLGLTPRIAEYRADCSDLAWNVLLHELVQVDLEYRRRQGECRRLEDYLAEFPELIQPPSAALGVGRSGVVSLNPDALAESRDPAASPPVPLVLGKIQLLELVGQGSFGRVYRGRDLDLGRIVAVKVPRIGLFTPGEEERFYREARSAAQLCHPHIVQVYDVGCQGGVPYLVCEYIEGQSLAARLARERLPYRQAAELTAMIAEALDYAHARGIIHRDVNPSNILLDAVGQPHLADFGLARRTEGEATLTLDGQLLGTPAYMSPEQASGHNRAVDARSDVYSLGVVLYELLTGARPFRGSTPALLHQVQHEDPEPPRRLDPPIPPELETICLKAMSKGVERRYATAAALAADLRRFLRGEPIEARPTSGLEQGVRWCRRHPTLVGLTAALVLVLTIVAGASFWEARASWHREREQRREALLLQLQRERLKVHAAGWSDTAWGLAAEAAALRVDSVLQGEAVATLSGLDAHRLREFQLDASSLAFDARGRLLIGGRDASPQPRTSAVPSRLWDGVSNEPSLTAEAGAGPVAFAPEGTPVQLLRHGEDAVQLRDLARGTVLSECRFDPWSSPLFEITDLAISADASRVAASARAPVGPGQLAAWDSATGKLLLQTTEGPSILALSARGDRLAAAEKDRILLWSLPAGERLTELRGAHAPISCLAFSPDGKTLAAGELGGSITLWDLASRFAFAHCHGSRHEVRALAFSPDGVTLASGGRGMVRLWDVATGRLLLDLEAGDYLDSLAFSPDARRLAAGGHTAWVAGKVVVWELEPGRGVLTLRGPIGQIFRIVQSPDGRRLAALANDWRIGIWDLESGRLLQLLTASAGLSADDAALAFSRDSQRLAFAAGTTAQLWNVGTGRDSRRWSLPRGLGDLLTFDPDGGLLLLRTEREEEGGRYTRWLLRDLLGPEPLRPLVQVRDFNRPPFAVLAAPDGRTFVAEAVHEGPEGRRQNIVALDARTGQARWSFPIQEPSQSCNLRLDPTGQFLVRDTGADPLVLALSTGQVLGTPPYPAYYPGPGLDTFVTSTLAFPGFEQGYAFLHRGDTHPRLLLAIDLDPPTLPVFAHDGTQLFVGTSDGTVLVYQLAAIRDRLARIGLY